MVIKEEPFKYMIRKFDLFENEKVIKSEEHSFEIETVHQVKDNSFYLLSKERETFFLNIPNITDIKPIGIEFAITRIRIVKQRFEVNKWFASNTSISLLSNEEFILYHINKKIIVSFLDSVEELTQLSSYISKAKYPIVYLGRIMVDNLEHFIAVHQDLTCEIFSYDQTIREIRLEKCFTLVYDDDLKNIKCVSENDSLIVYTKGTIHLFSLRNYLDSSEIEPSKVINLNNIFNVNPEQCLFFTDYFKSNFPLYISEVTNQLSPQSGKEINISITSSILFTYLDNRSIYYIVGTNTGKVAMFDIFFTECFLLTPLIMIDYHKAEITSLTIFDNRILIISSIDGMITFTDICSQKIEAAINRINSNEINKSSIQDVPPNKIFQKVRRDSIEPFIRQFNYTLVRKASLHNKRDDNLISHNENKLLTIRLAPFNKIKNYSRLIRIMKIIQLDTDQIESFQSNNILAFELEDENMIIIKMDTYEIIYSFHNISSQASVQAVYHLKSTHSLVFYLSNNTIIISSYLTRTCDRHISDPETIYNILKVNEKLDLVFPNKTHVNDYINNISISSLKYNEPLKDSNNNGKQLPFNMEITLESIEKYVTSKHQKEFFIMKYYQNLTLNRQYLNTSIHNEENYSSIIDKIIHIITNNKDGNGAIIDENIKKIQIMNLIYNPQYFVNLQTVDHSTCSKTRTCTGVLSNLIELGNQYTQFVSFDYSQYFPYIESVIRHQENIDNIYFRTNYFNWISLFHIWNFSLDLDTFLYQRFKLVQPIFDFYPILLGENSACSMLFNEEGYVDDKTQSFSKFSQHFDFFLNFVNTAYQDKAKDTSSSVLRRSSVIVKNDQGKKEMFLNKSTLVDSYQGFLVNFKNYSLSTNTSHHLHLCLFGSLMALLGYEMNNDLCYFIDSEKKIMKILSSKYLIEYCNMEMFHQFMYTNIDDIPLANNGLMLVDYLTLESTLIGKVRVSIPKSSRKFKRFLCNIVSYISKVYMFIFDLQWESMKYQTFPTLNRNLNLDACGKLEFLSEFELSIISFILNFYVIDRDGKLPHEIAIKAFQLLILFVFKIINSQDKSSINMAYVKTVIELLEKSEDLVEEIYKEYMPVYSKILIDFYTSNLSVINLDALFKPFSIGSIRLIKSDLNANFVKIILAKLIKLFSKTKLNFLLRLIVEEFKKKVNPLNSDYHTFLIELLWLLMKDRHHKIPQYLPTVANLIMLTFSPLNKDLKPQCIDYSKKVLSALIANYPMISVNALTQKLVVGATDGKVYIYDMTTGNLWKNWIAHDSEITAVILDTQGVMLLSYSSTDCFVKYWTIGLANFFRNFFSMKDGYFKQRKLTPISMKISSEEKLVIVKFQFTPKKNNEIILTRENNSVEIFKI